MNGKNEVLTIDELAEALKIKKTWLYRATMKKDESSIPRIKLGKHLRFIEEDVRVWMKQFAVGMKVAA